MPAGAAITVEPTTGGAVVPASYGGLEQTITAGLIATGDLGTPGFALMA